MMHRRTAVGIPALVAAIVVTAVVVSAAIFAASPFSTTVTKTLPETTTTTSTIVSTYTTTVTLPQGSLAEQCVVTEYHVWSIESISGTSTIGGTSTQSQPVTTYQTSASVSQTVGYVTTTTNTYTGTTTGYLAYWNSTACTYISG
jgi:hypothetical protein